MNNRYPKFLLLLIFVIFLCGFSVTAESTKNLQNKAAALEAQGDYPEAIAMYNQALQMDKFDPVIYRNKVIDLLKLGLENDAQIAIKKAKEVGILIEINSDGTVTVPGLQGNYYQSPIASQQTGGLKFPSSVPTPVPTVISTPPPVTVTHVNSSVNSPVSQINSEPFSHTPRLSFIVGITPENKKKLEDTLKTLEIQVTKDPKNLTIWAEKSNTLRLLGRFSEAVTEYDRILKENPDYYPALTGKATVITEANNPEINGNLSGYTPSDAINAYEKSLEIHPDDPITLTGLGYAYRFVLEADTEEDKEKNRQNSLQAFSKALQTQNGFPEALIGRSLILENNDESIKDLQLVISKYPHIAETYALLYLITRDSSYLEKTIEIEPNQPYPLVFLGASLLDSGKMSKAAETYNQAYEKYLLLEKFPGDYCELWLNLVRSYSDSGDESQSKEYSLKVPDTCKGGE